MIRLVASQEDIKRYAIENNCSQRVVKKALKQLSSDFCWSERIAERIKEIFEFKED